MTGPTAELADQIVVEIMDRDLDSSIAFYAALGFRLERRDEGFAALRWRVGEYSSISVLICLH